MESGVLANAAILLVSLFGLYKGSDFIVDNVVKVSDITALGKSTLGFLLVALCTTLPELSVSVLSLGGGGNIGVAVGNAIGSNIVNICLILGLCFFLVGLRNSENGNPSSTFKKLEIRNLYSGLFGGSIIPLTLIHIGHASRFIGVILVAIFVFYDLQLFKRENKYVERIANMDRTGLRKYLLFVLSGAAIVVASAYFVVDSASCIATYVGIPSLVIGATLVAFSTSLPELTNSVQATRKGHLDLALGNIVGAGFVDTTLVLGVSLIGSPLRVEMASFSGLVMFSIITNLFLWYFLASEKIGLREGALFLSMYLLFLTASFGLYRF